MLLRGMSVCQGVCLMRRFTWFVRWYLSDCISQFVPAVCVSFSPMFAASVPAFVRQHSSLLLLLEPV